MTALVGYLLLFTAVGILFLLANLLVGKLVRPALPNEEKQAIYECGEPTIGSSWVQFDLRFYVVALLFIIFDVEVAFFFPWATVFGKSHRLASATPEQVQQQLADGNEVALTLADGRATVPGDAVGQSAQRLALIAFVDILVFFGVLLVGFAYVWKRGDIDWVRAVARERALAAGQEPAPAPEAVEAA